MIPNDFNSIYQENGEQFLRNEFGENRLCSRLERLEEHYEGVRALLQECDLPANSDFTQRVARGGRDGLEGVVREMTEKTITRLCIPSYMADSFRRSAPEEIQSESYQLADKLRDKIADIEGELPINAEDYIFTEESVLDIDAIRTRIFQGCRIRITKEMKAEADKVLRVADELRDLELSGLNCIELASRYARAKEAPAPAFLYRDIVFRRHAPGTLADSLDIVFNEVARRDAPMNPLR